MIVEFVHLLVGPIQRLTHEGYLNSLLGQQGIHLLGIHMLKVIDGDTLQELSLLLSQVGLLRYRHQMLHQRNLSVCQENGVALLVKNSLSSFFLSIIFFFTLIQAENSPLLAPDASNTRGSRHP